MTRMGCGISKEATTPGTKSSTEDLKQGAVSRISNISSGVVVKGPSDKKSLYSKKVPDSDLAFMEHRVDTKTELLNKEVYEAEDPMRLYKKCTSSPPKNTRTDHFPALIASTSKTYNLNTSSLYANSSSKSTEWRESPRIIRHRAKNLEQANESHSAPLPSQVQDPVALWPVTKKEKTRLNVEYDDSSSSYSYDESSSFIFVNKQVRVAWDSQSRRRSRETIHRREQMSTQETNLSSSSVSSSSSTSSTYSSKITNKIKVPFENNRVYQLHVEVKLCKGWRTLSGLREGQTQTDCPELGSTAYFCHPIDVHLATRTVQGWPKIYLQIWHQDAFGRQEICGYGFCHIPTTPGEHEVICNTWRPAGSMRQEMLHHFVGGGMQLRNVETVFTSMNRYKLTTVTMGTIKLRLGVILRNFDKFGIECGS